MSRILFVVGILLPLAAAVPPGAAAPRSATDEQRDKRLSQPVKLEAAVGISVKGPVQKIADAVEVRLDVEPALQSRRVAVVPSESRPAWEVMDALAAAVGAHWVRLGKDYVLCRVPELAEFARMTREELEKLEVGTMKVVVRSLSPDQVQALRAGQHLPIQTLTAEQQRLSLVWAGAEVTRWPEWELEGALGTGVFLATVPPGRHPGIGFWLEQNWSTASELAGSAELPQ